MKDAEDKLLDEIGRDLLRILKLLMPHFKEIRGEWLKTLRSFKFEADGIDELLNLMLEGQYQNLRSAKMGAYKLALARAGQMLDRRGVLPSYVTLAMTVYLEVCCKRLMNLGIREPELAFALIRLNSASQMFVLSGYATQRWSGWWRFAEQERRRFSQNLHDEVGHSLVVLKLYLELMAMDYKNGKTQNLGGKLQEAMALVSQGIASLRRLILDLGPAMLDEVGLMPSLKLYTRQFATRTGIQVHVNSADYPKIERPQETALYRVVQGALSNVMQHAGAKNVKINLGTMKDTLVMVIEDDGQGFDLTSKSSGQRFGLASMRERIEALGGRFHLESWPANQGHRRVGTRIEVDLPLNGNVKDE